MLFVKEIIGRALPTRENNRKQFIWFAAWSVMFVITIAALSPPLLMHVGGPAASAGSFIYLAFSRVCHQLPGRSLVYLDYPAAVCIRCIALYFGILAGITTVLWTGYVHPFRRMKSHEILRGFLSEKGKTRSGFTLSAGHRCVFFIIITGLFALAAIDSAANIVPAVSSPPLLRAASGFILGFAPFLIPVSFRRLSGSAASPDMHVMHDPVPAAPREPSRQYGRWSKSSSTTADDTPYGWYSGFRERLRREVISGRH
jgi:uncharacterized membrane protein